MKNFIRFGVVIPESQGWNGAISVLSKNAQNVLNFIVVLVGNYGLLFMRSQHCEALGSYRLHDNWRNGKE